MMRRAAGILRRLEVLPRTPPLGKVEYRPRLVIYVVGLSILALGTAVVTVKPTQDPLTLSVASAVVFLMALYAVRSLPAMQSSWNASVFLNLGISVTFGPVGAAASTLAEAFGSGIRSRNGWFRTLFNVVDIFLANIAAWATFSTVTQHAPGLIGEATAGLAAGLIQLTLNYGLIAVVVRLADPEVPVQQLARGALSLLPYSTGYGVAAFAFVVMHNAAGLLGFATLLIPVVLLQGFLVIFAVRINAYEEQRAAHQREREALLQKAIDASESERRRIARDLHDGVVQNLAGMAFSLTATASELKSHAAANGNSNLIDLLEQSAEETRVAMKDLRTLIIEIAPPTLRREGLHAALLEVLQTIKDAGTKTKLELPSNMRLRQDRASLIFRVAQEVLRNVAAHAEAKHVSVILKEVENTAELRIMDDGKGFTPEDVARRRAEGHVGTNAIVELAEEAGGSLTIDSSPGKGTRVTLSVPTE